MQLHSLFVDFLALGQISDVNNDAIINFFKKLQSANDGRVVSNVGGFQTNDLTASRNADFDALSARVLDIVQVLARETGLRQPHIASCWGNINNKHSFNSAHIHPNSVMSAVYYAKALPNQGSIVFQRNDVSSLFLLNKTENRTVFNVIHHEHEPKTGDFIVFPAWLNHYVRPNETDESRVSVAFNFDVT